jgi:hypothetical protein
MRKLNSAELDILNTLKTRKKVTRTVFQKRKSLKVQYKIDGNATLAVVEGVKFPLLGYAKLNPADKKLGLEFNEEIGKRLAFARALKNGEKNVE